MDEKLTLEQREQLYGAMVEEIKKENPQLSALPTRLISKMIMAESTFNPRAVSSAGAVGLMQVKPSTARGLGMGDADLTDPEQNILTGMTYLHSLLRQFGGLSPALQAYNIGPTAYRQGKRAPRYLKKVR